MLDPPKVKVCPLVVAKFPPPVRKVLLFVVPAEMEAVGVPELTLINAKSAEVVA